jgi:hypothetical protein
MHSADVCRSAMQRRYFTINLLPYREDIKNKFEDCKKNMNVEELEMKLARNFYYFSKGANSTR